MLNATFEIAIRELLGPNLKSARVVNDRLKPTILIDTIEPVEPGDKAILDNACPFDVCLEYTHLGDPVLPDIPHDKLVVGIDHAVGEDHATFGSIMKTVASEELKNLSASDLTDSWRTERAYADQLNQGEDYQRQIKVIYDIEVEISRRLTLLESIKALVSND